MSAQNPLEESTVRLKIEDTSESDQFSAGSRGSIDVVIVHSDQHPAGDVTTKPATLLTVSPTRTISEIIQDFQSRVSHGSQVQLMLEDGHTAISSQKRVADLTSTQRLILKAQTLTIDDVVTSSYAGLFRLWSHFAVRYIVELTKRRPHALPEKVQEKIIQRWLNLSDARASDIYEEIEILEDSLDDEVSLRSFFIFYHQSLNDFRSSNGSIPGSLNHHIYFTTVFQRWQTETSTNVATFMNAAYLNMRRYPIPNMPNRRPKFRMPTGAERRKVPLETQVQLENFKAFQFDIAADSADKLEAQAAAASEVLIKIRAKALSLRIPYFDHKIKQIDEVQSSLDTGGVKIGLVGCTGAGKSSIINAMLDEAKLIPTSCWRACTAVVTEISYNHQTNGQPYRATVKFISQEEWKAELNILCLDIADADATNLIGDEPNSSDVTEAWDKISAVYPHLNRKSLTRATTDTLLQHANVVDLLGRQHEIKASTAEQLCRELRRFIDSRDRKGVPQARLPSFWPLIESVHLFTRSPLLATGVTLVDLPGVHDSNAARAAVATRYMKECSHLWIVAPMTRAIDDKSARDLLGQSFKQQMALDGAYSSMTFIGSKSDDVGLDHEITSAFCIDEELKVLEEITQALLSERSDIELQIKLKDEDKAKESSTSTQIQRQIDLYEMLLEQCEEIGTVFEPRDPSDETTSHRSKRRRIGNNLSQSQSSEGSQSSSTRRRLTLEDIEVKLGELGGLQDASNATIYGLNSEIAGLNDRVEKVNLEVQLTHSRRWRKCVEARNEATQAAIRADFVQGIRECEEEMAQDDQADANHQEYAQIQETLPVFCVSARGYQRLTGLLGRIKHVDEFDNPEQTEIPAIQTHAKTLARLSRESHLRRFLNQTAILINNIKIWANGNAMSADLSDDQISKEITTIKAAQDFCMKAFSDAAGSTIDTVSKNIDNNILVAMSRANEAAASDVMTTVTAWGVPVKDGGIHNATYKAIVRRSGLYTNRTSSYDFSEQLVRPVMNAVAAGWARTFHSELPITTQRGATQASKALMEFDAAVKHRIEDLKLDNSVIEVLNQQLPKYHDQASDAFVALQYSLIFEQKDASRALKPAITKCMKAGYEIADIQRGTGSHNRRKSAVQAQADREKENMFEAAKHDVETIFQGMMSTGKKELVAKLETIARDITEDYLASFINPTKQLTLKHITLQLELKEVLEDFEKAAAGLGTCTQIE